MEVNRCNLRDAFGCHEDGMPLDGISESVWNAAERGFQTDNCAIVIELMRDGNTFWPCIGTVTEVPVQPKLLGRTYGPHTVKGLGDLALEVFASFLTYNLVGANCQHFVRELGRKVGLGKEGEDQLVPDDVTTINWVVSAMMAGRLSYAAGSVMAGAKKVVTKQVCKQVTAMGLRGWFGCTTPVVQTTWVTLPAYTTAQIGAGVLGASALGLTVGYGIGTSANRLLQQTRRRRNDQGSSRKHVRMSAFTKRVANKMRGRVGLSSRVGLLL